MLCGFERVDLEALVALRTCVLLNLIDTGVLLRRCLANPHPLGTADVLALAHLPLYGN